jgi:hypothetical protein
MDLSVPELGAIFLLLFGIFYWLGIFATIRAVLAFLGVVAVGSGGFIGGLLTSIVNWAQGAAGSVTGWALGVGLPVALTIGLGVVFFYFLHPRNQTSKHTGWIGLALGALVVGGTAGIPALSGLDSGIIQALSSAVSIISGA